MAIFAEYANFGHTKEKRETLLVNGSSCGHTQLYSSHAIIVHRSFISSLVILKLVFNWLSSYTISLVGLNVLLKLL